MAKTRAEKEAFVKELNQQFSEARMAVLTRFSGTSVENMTTLRKGIRDGNGSYRVIKNTLGKLASEGTGAQELFEDLSGPAGVAFTFGDPVELAKQLKEFAKEVDSFEIGAGFLLDKTLTADQIKEIADLPSREELLAKAFGSMRAPIQNFHGVLNNLLRGFVVVLAAIKTEKEKQSA